MTQPPLTTDAHASGAAPAPRAGSSLPTLFWMGAAVVFGTGWIVERRKRRLLESEKDSILWADKQSPGPSIITTAGIDDILPDSPSPAEAARAIWVAPIGETMSRREATLIDLHELDGKLERRRNRGDAFAGVLLLQQHLADFRYTSPWVFLELRDLYRRLDRKAEWETARVAFRKRFGQNAPAWDAPCTGLDDLLADAHLCDGLAHEWPHREARMFIIKWMLGDPQMRQQSSGPPLLSLGVYRDLLAVDALLDEVMVARTVPVDSLL